MNSKLKKILICGLVIAMATSGNIFADERPAASLLFGKSEDLVSPQVVNMEGIREADQVVIENGIIEIGGEKLIQSVENILIEKGSMQFWLTGTESFHTLSPESLMDEDFEQKLNERSGYLELAVSSVMKNVGTQRGGNFMPSSPEQLTGSKETPSPAPMIMKPGPQASLLQQLLALKNAGVLSPRAFNHFSLQTGDKLEKQLARIRFNEPNPQPSPSPSPSPSPAPPDSE